jgi:hypothetical protein
MQHSLSLAWCPVTVDECPRRALDPALNIVRLDALGYYLERWSHVPYASPKISDLHTPFGGDMSTDAGPTGRAPSTIRFPCSTGVC